MSLTRLKYLMNEGTDDEIAQYLKQLGIGVGAPMIGAPIAWISSTQMPNEIMPSMKGMVFLKLNGQTFDKELYPDLAKCLPSGVLPELRGEFIRGLDDGRGVDAGRVINTGQDATYIRTAVQDYYGVDVSPSVKVGISFASADKIQTFGLPDNSKAGDSSIYVPASSDNSVTGNQRTAEDGFNSVWISVRPRNVSFMYIVRAK